MYRMCSTRNRQLAYTTDTQIQDVVLFKCQHTSGRENRGDGAQQPNSTCLFSSLVLPILAGAPLNVTTMISVCQKHCENHTFTLDLCGGRCNGLWSRRLTAPHRHGHFGYLRESLLGGAVTFQATQVSRN